MKQKNGDMKSRKIGCMVMLFLLVILVSFLVAYRYYKNNITGGKFKSELLQAFEKNELGFFLEHELYRDIAQRKEENPYEFSSHITASNSMENNMFSNMDLSKFDFQYSRIQNSAEKKGNHKLEIQYAGSDFLTFDFVTTPKQFAIKSDEIVNRYVGLNLANMQNTVNQLYQTQVDLSNFRKIKNFFVDREKIAISQIQNTPLKTTLAQIIQKEILPENVSKKENVVVMMNSEQITTTEYTVSFSNQQRNNVLEGISQILEKDQEFLSQLVVTEVEEIEDGTILEYTDNDNTVEVSGEETKFNTSLEIWGENTTNQEQVLNTVPANTIVENTTVPTENIVTNQVANQVTNQITNSITNQTVNEISNQVSNEITTVPVNEIPTENTTLHEPTQVSPEIPQQPNEQPAIPNVIPEEVIEEDNVRTQGYIGVNEDQEDYGPTDAFIIGENYEETLKNITHWIEKMDWKTYLLTGAKANCTQEELKEKFQEILQRRRKKNNSIIAKVYVSEGRAIKFSFQIPETQENFDLEIFSLGDNEKYLKMSYLVGEEGKASGNILNFYVKKSDATNKSQISIHKINKNKISQKINFEIQTKGTIQAKKYTTDIEMTYSSSEGEFKSKLNNTLNFDITPEIEDLNEENCLFLDLLSNEDLLLLSDAIEQKTYEVLKEKNKNLNIVDFNNTNFVVQPTEQNTQPEQNDDKEQAKQVLIQTIRDKMKEYLDQGKQLQIEDLQNLEIPDYEVNLSISSNLAIITVNGYGFKLDSDFNLSDS